MSRKFEDGLEMGLTILAAENDRNRQEIRRLRESTIWGRLSNFLSNKHKRFDIKIVYNKADIKFAEELRKFLELQNHIAYAFPIEDYRHLPGTIADYTIFINDCDEIFRKYEKVILNQFGCFIAVRKSQIVINYDEKAINSQNLNSFIEYYNNILDNTQDLDVQQLKVEQVKSENFTVEAFEHRLKQTLDRTDFLATKLSWGLATLYLVSQLPVIFAHFGISIPLIITEEIFKNMSTELKNQRHQKKFIPICQKQIIQLSLCDYLK